LNEKELICLKSNSAQQNTGQEHLANKRKTNIIFPQGKKKNPTAQQSSACSTGAEREGWKQGPHHREASARQLVTAPVPVAAPR